MTSPTHSRPVLAAYCLPALCRCCLVVVVVVLVVVALVVVVVVLVVVVGVVVHDCRCQLRERQSVLLLLSRCLRDR